ncbi:hypothetical protein Q5P01_002491 [Channa striata]|uniref:Uncharacterized protein n=1 Tax=Channa striata TaxID=64152 RepID=A0AA88P0R1_CHASR|nr:hypothetical protein Q5P01_002491 [Channa striata]
MPSALMLGRELCTPLDLVFGPHLELEISGGAELHYCRWLKEHLKVVPSLGTRLPSGCWGLAKVAVRQSVPWESFSVAAVSNHESSSLPVALITGLVCGIVLVILLLLLYHCRQSKDSCFIRQIQSDSYSRDENQHHEYTSALPGEACIYESIKDCENPGNGESHEVTYSAIELKHVEKKRWDHKAEQSRVYSDVKTETTDDSLTYAQINHHNKGKAKKKKGKSSAAATDELVYSEVKPGTAAGL